MREAHAHLFSLGRSLTLLRLNTCTSRVELLETLKAQSGRGWIIAVQLRIEGFTDDPRWPTRTELDAVTGNRPCILVSFDHHSAAANTAAFQAAGLSLTASDPPGGVICRDANGVANGLLLESAYHYVWKAVPEPAPQEREGLLLAALDHLRSFGYVEVHDLLSQPWLGPLLADLHDRGELMLDVWLYPPVHELPNISNGELPHYARTKGGKGRGSITLAGGKLFADGTLNSATAWMLHPYIDGLPQHPTGTPLLNITQLKEGLQRTAAAGIGLSVHAIGDGAVRAVLDAREQTQHKPWLTIAGTRIPALRIEHCELIDVADIPRFAHLQAVASVQPCHLLTDIEVLQRKLPHRLDRVLPLRDLINAGALPGELLWFSSDVPIVSADPADSYQAAIHRGRATDNITIAPEQALTRAECDAAFNAA